MKRQQPILLLACTMMLAITVPARAEPGGPHTLTLHLLNRIAYGPSMGDVERVEKMGLDNYIEEQLHPENIPVPHELQQALSGLHTTQLSLVDLAREFVPEKRKGEKLSEEQKKAMREQSKIVADEMRDAKLWRAIYSPAQLQEVLVDFWFNHFNVYDDKGHDRILIGTYERDAIRPYVLGKFRDLLEATARHPAMQVYLDNWLNSDPNSRFARGKFEGLNENYAREIMELHTMGVDGGYTQADVTSLARIFTGWGIGMDPHDKAGDAVFYFDDRRHDKRNKTFLSYDIHASGRDEAEEAMDILASHPSTAHHIAYKLAQYFVADAPPETLVKSLAQTFTKTGGNIRAVMSVLLHSPEFWDPKYDHVKFKPPFRYAVSAFRASNAPLANSKAVLNHLHGMSEPLYHCLTPDGYPAVNEHWLDSDALLRRMDFARNIVSGRFSRTEEDKENKTKLPPPDPDAMMAILGNGFSAHSTEVFNSDHDPRLRSVLVLSSPEFLYY